MLHNYEQMLAMASDSTTWPQDVFVKLFTSDESLLIYHHNKCVVKWAKSGKILFVSQCPGVHKKQRCDLLNRFLPLTFFVWKNSIVAGNTETSGVCMLKNGVLSGGRDFEIVKKEWKKEQKERVSDYLKLRKQRRNVALFGV